MSFQSTFRDFLLADPTIFALVGDRIYPTILPQNADLPAIVYGRVGGRTEHRPQAQTSGQTRNFTVSVQAHGSNYDQADAVEVAVYNRFEQYTDALKCRPLGETTDQYDPDTKQFITASDYSCWYRPA